MTNDQTLKELNKYRKMFKNETLESLIEAVSKQIPKKPRDHKYATGNIIKVCPECETVLDGCNYCMICGQKIEWEE